MREGPLTEVVLRPSAAVLALCFAMRCLSILGRHRCLTLIHVLRQIGRVDPHSWCQSLLAEVTLTQTPVPAPASWRSNIPGTCHIWHSVLSAVLWPFPVFRAGDFVLAAGVRFNHDNFPWTLVPETDVLEKCTFVSYGFMKYYVKKKIITLTQQSSGQLFLMCSLTQCEVNFSA